MQDDRTERLEFKVAHLEKALQELSDVLYAQQKTIDVLSAELSRMKQKLDALEPGLVDASLKERPPHY